MNAAGSTEPATSRRAVRPAARLQGLLQRDFEQHLYPLGYARGLDGLRAIVTLAVVVFHLRAPLLPGGFVAMDGFFVLSGYFISALLLRDWLQRGRADILAFYRRRTARILPALAVMLAATLLYRALTRPDWSAGAIVDAVGYALGGGWWPMAGGTLDPAFGHLWSLAIEVQFYAVWPVVFLALLAAFGTGWRLAAAIVLLALAVWAWRLWTAAAGAPWQRLYGFIDMRVDSMLFGAALACALPLVGGTARTALAARLRPLAVPLLVFGVVTGYAFEHTGRAYYEFGSVVCGALPAVLAVTILVLPGTTVLHRLYERPELVAFGRISYAIYLWHFPILWIMREDLSWRAGTRAAIGLPLTVLAAIASYVFVERHFMRRAATVPPTAKVQPT